jgi:hypothetical protein
MQDLATVWAGSCVLYRAPEPLKAERNPRKRRAAKRKRGHDDGHVLNVGASLETATSGLATQIAYAHDFALELVLPGSMYPVTCRPHPHHPCVASVCCPVGCACTANASWHDDLHHRQAGRRSNHIVTIQQLPVTMGTWSQALGLLVVR